MHNSKTTFVLVHGAWATAFPKTRLPLAPVLRCRPSPSQRSSWAPPRANSRPEVNTSRYATANQRAVHSRKAPRPLWKDKPVWFLVAENDRMIPAKTQHFQAKRMKAIVRAHAVDHAPMLTAPDVVIDVLLEATRDIVKETRDSST